MDGLARMRPRGGGLGALTPPNALSPWVAEDNPAIAAQAARDTAATRTRQSVIAPNVMDQAQAQYPILQGLGLQYKRGAPDANGNMLEFWPPGETGTSDRPRPQQFDMQRPGIEVYSDKVRPIDILGDAVSHHMIQSDPTVAKTYQDFGASLTPDQKGRLQEQYAHAQQHAGETRDYPSWESASGLPAYFRGYAFQQWPAEFNDRAYTPEQKQSLDGMIEYLRGGQ